MNNIAVIGSGFGGLAVAVRLQARGFQVKIFEKNHQIGGHASQLQKDGYSFDMGPSLITAPEIINRIFRSAGRNIADYLDLIPLNPFYRIYFHDGTVFDYSGDPEQMKLQLARFHTKDAANYDKFMQYTAQLYKSVITDGLGSQPFDLSTLINFLPQALKLKALMPVSSVVNRYFKDFRSRFIFSFHPLFIGGSPFRSPAVYLMIPYLEKSGGVWFTKGGMYSVIKALEKLFLELGGQIFTGTEVQQITVLNGKASGVVAGNSYSPADAVISNAHFAHTYTDLIKPEHRKKWKDKKIKSLSYSMSSFLIYLGVKKQFPQLQHHTLILSKRYKELVRDIFDRKILPNDFSLYLHTPTRTDPSMAPPGCDSMYILVPTPNLAGDINWKQLARPYAQKILNFLENDFGLAGLQANIEVMEIYTPLDFALQRNNYLGSAWGVEPRLSQTANFRPQNRSEDIENLYLVGANTHPGAGVPGVLLSAETTESAFLQDLKTSPVAFPANIDIRQEGHGELLVR